MFSVLFMLMNGIWGALVELPEKRFTPSIPTTLGYIVWSLTFIPCALYILYRINWELDRSLQPTGGGVVSGFLWLLLSLAAFLLFGFHGFYAKVAMKEMLAGSVFVYITISNLLFVPLACYMTNFS